tara:strand:+ start:3657 stop:3926 length:270 start_codon:yes stop_codon:yes gene_type:complete
VIIVAHPDDRDRDTHKVKKGKKTYIKREDKSWRLNQKNHNDGPDEELEDLMLKINKQFRCKRCEGITSIYALKCSSCDDPNPYPAPQTH